MATSFLQQVINGLSLGSVYALIAVGYSLVYSILLFSNFAHGGFLVVGGYICYGMMMQYGMNVWVGGAAAIVGAGLVAVVTERFAYKPIRERTPLTLYLLIASMGVSIVIENFFVITIGGRFRALPPLNLGDLFPVSESLSKMSLQSPINIAQGITISLFDVITFVVAIVFLIGLQLFLQKTRWGLAIRAAACDLRTAGLMGVNVGLLVGIVFLVAGGLAAISGIFLAMRYTLFPQLGGITIKAFVAAVIGGLGSLPGAVVGSLILGLTEMLAAGFISSQMRDIVVFSLLVITLLVRPAGLFGKQIGDKV
ncbi:MAG: branched-chain amino acid ABC transporter permease [Synergistaceae bacterium]|nr:branched-chain amino acid ABC transporter permease [Synergistaceae bacterium]